MLTVGRNVKFEDIGETPIADNWMMVGLGKTWWHGLSMLMPVIIAIPLSFYALFTCFRNGLPNPTLTAFSAAGTLLTSLAVSWLLVYYSTNRNQSYIAESGIRIGKSEFWAWDVIGNVVRDGDCFGFCHKQMPGVPATYLPVPDKEAVDLLVRTLEQHNVPIISQEASAVRTIKLLAVLAAIIQAVIPFLLFAAIHVDIRAIIVGSLIVSVGVTIPLERMRGSFLVSKLQTPVFVDEGSEETKAAMRPADWSTTIVHHPSGQQFHLVRRQISTADYNARPNQAWNAVVDISYQLPLEQQSAIQRTASLVMLYDGEVKNGGHHQYFANSSGQYADETVDALNAIGATDWAALLSEAIRRWPGQPRQAFGSVRDYVKSAGQGEFGDLDSHYFTAKPGVDDYLLAYANANINEFVEVIADRPAL